MATQPQPALRRPEETREQTAARVLHGINCACGSVKTAEHSFCWRCAKKLPKDLLGNVLGSSFKTGYTDAWFAAIDWLKANTTRFPKVAE